MPALHKSINFICTLMYNANKEKHTFYPSTAVKPCQYIRHLLAFILKFWIVCKIVTENNPIGCLKICLYKTHHQQPRGSDTSLAPCTSKSFPLKTTGQPQQIMVTRSHRVGLVYSRSIALVLNLHRPVNTKQFVRSLGQRKLCACLLKLLSALVVVPFAH